MSNTSNQKALVYNICQFLKTSLDNGSISSDDAEGIQVAVECIAEAFGVDPESESQSEQYSIKPATLQSIFDISVRAKEAHKNASSSSSASAPASTPSAAPASSSQPITAEQKAEAEKHKSTGNSLMTSKKYTDAIAAYGEAIAIDARNPVYYSNRAAAWGSVGDHAAAAKDAEKALEVDPNFVKAYSRLGHAHYSLSDFPKSVEAYKKGLLLDPTNTNLKAALANAEARLPKDAEEDEDSDPDEAPVASTSAPRGGAPAGGMPDLSSLMGMMGGMGGGGAGGMPDFASMMKNPQLMKMAEQMMAGGGMDEIMKNPSVQAMAERMQRTGQPPSMADLAADPSIAEAAAKFGAGQRKQ